MWDTELRFIKSSLAAYNKSYLNNSWLTPKYELLKARLDPDPD